MDNFKRKFLEEASEHIEDIEKALLELDGDSENTSLIEQIFRAMHSLKGGGAMFGFEKISEFTHNLETIYDKVRNGKLDVSNDLLNTTLASVDHIKLLLANDDELDEEMLFAHEQLMEKVNVLMSDMGAETIMGNGTLKTDSSEKKNDITYYIHFVPNNDIFSNGTNPLYLVDELSMLGTALVIPNFNKLPEFSKLKPDICYTSWEIIIATKVSKDELLEVFMFVESDSFLEIEKLGNSNLLENKKFYSYILEYKNAGKEIGLTEIQKNLENFGRSVSSKVKKVIQNNKLAVKDNSISSIRVASEKLDSLMNLVSELVTTQARLSLFAELESNSELNTISENVQKLSKQLRDITFSIVLIPVETMITRFQRLVRDLSYGLKKEIRFVAEGTDTELDKTIIENLTDPLLHLLRNCIDHGIETPEERKKKNKPIEGTILFKAFYSGANVHIQIKDDGAGIDTDFIRNRAIEKGLIKKEADLSKKEILDLIFISGFSTAKTVTDVSGRGVGMDVVKKKINGIRGDVEIESDIDKGTLVTIKLPLTLSIIDGLLVRIDQTFYVIPLVVVEKIHAVEHSTLTKSFNNIITLDETQYPFFNLRDEFELPEFKDADEQIIIVKFDEKRVGISVDEVIGEYQAVLKPLGKHYKNQEIISGATILGDGTIALVIDTNKAIKYFIDNHKINEEVEI